MCQEYLLKGTIEFLHIIGAHEAEYNEPPAWRTHELKHAFLYNGVSKVLRKGYM